MNLTPKQEAFALAYIETGNASEAYRRSYDASRTKPDVVHVKASQLLADGRIAVRVEQLRAELVERNAVTVDSLIAELDEARVAALGAMIPQSSAAVSASLGKAKLLGLLTDKIDAKVTEKRTIVLNFGIEPESDQA